MQAQTASDELFQGGYSQGCPTDCGANDRNQHRLGRGPNLPCLCVLGRLALSSNKEQAAWLAAGEVAVDLARSA